MASSHRSVPRRRPLVLALGIIASAASLLAGAPSASAVTTIGSDLASAPTIQLTCTPDCTVAQRALPGREVTAPSDGVIVRWRVRSGLGANGESVRLRVIRGTGAASTGVGSSQPESVPSSGIFTYDTSVPIAAGDYIGIDCCDDGGPFFTATPGAQRDEWEPLLGDGETRAPSTQVADREILVNADIEPDCDGDGLGDESQDPDTSSCNPIEPKADRTLTLDSNKGKVEKGRKVRLTGQIDAPLNEAACEPNQTVELQRKKKKQPDTAFQTFKTAQTDAAGNYSLKVKVKKTRIYRAVVRENASCDEELSNTQKVRVQKKKAAQEA